jgi:hypothetical protein
VGLPALSALGLAASPGPWSEPGAFVLGMRVALAAGGALVLAAALLTAMSARGVSGLPGNHPTG